jgi:uncharacterized repeat protein (TIGR02543 family)
MAKRILTLLLAVILIASTGAAALAANPENMTFEFLLTSNRDTIEVDDEVVVTLTLKRTDDASTYNLHTMQDELVFDGEFLSLISAEANAELGSGARVTVADKKIICAFMDASKDGTEVGHELLIATLTFKALKDGDAEVTSTNYKVNKFDGGAYASTANTAEITIAPTASEKYTVTFDSRGGSSVSSQEVEKDAKAVKPADPTRDGYTFTGWYTDEACTEEFDFNTKITGDLTLYAGWEEKEPTEQWLEKPFIDGYPDGTFAPEGQIKRVEAVKILYNLFADGAEADLDVLDKFSDIPSNHWGINELAWAVSEGYLKGDEGADTMRPDDTIKRAELTALAYRIDMEYGFTDGMTQLPTPPAFDDTEGHWGGAEIAFLTKYNILRGYEDGSFRPENPITRAETVAVISRLIGRTEYFTPGKTFPDVKSVHWAYKNIMNAANGLKAS